MVDVSTVGRMRCSTVIVDGTERVWGEVSVHHDKSIHKQYTIPTMSTESSQKSPLAHEEGKRRSRPRTCRTRRFKLETQDSTQELKDSQRRTGRRNGFCSLFSSRKRSSSPLCPPKRWSFPTISLRRRTLRPRRRSYNSSSRRGFSTASLELELQRDIKCVLDHQSSSTSLASIATTGAIDEALSK